MDKYIVKLSPFSFKQVIFLVLGLNLLVACSHPKTESYLTGPTMGTIYNIKYVPVEGIKSTVLQSKIDAVLLKVNQLMSTYMEDSELSRFNQWKSTQPFPLSPETLKVMKEAKRLGALSDGYLDVTVGPLVNLWGFGPEARPDKVPSETDILAAKQRVGLERLILNSDSAQKTHADLYVDLSTIAKGYGVDRVAELLEQQGIHQYLVEVGGEMRLSGKKLNGQDWRVAIEKPVTTERAIERIISVGNNAIATSGDYRNYYEDNGVRYSHLIDPSTGKPITHNLVSVTVVNPSSMTADGLATALNVMGKDKALEIAEKYGLAILMITKEKDGFKEYTSRTFDEIVTVY